MLNRFFLILFFLYTGQTRAQQQAPSFDWNSAKGKDGFFRVVKTSHGQWWFVDANNKPFYYKGVCAVNRAGTMGGRRALPGAYAPVVDRKYQYQQGPDAFVQASLGKLRQLGFNALGAWATEEFFNQGMPFTEIIEFFKEPPFLPAVGRREGLPDLFDSVWLINADRKARALCTPLRNSKELVGYFTDNEIGFGKAADDGFDLGFEAGQFDYSLLRTLLGSDTARAATKAAWRFLLDRYNGSVQKLSEAWGIPVQSVADISVFNKEGRPIPGAAYEADAAAFSAFYAQKYFQLAHQLIRRYDPNHLILGCRFGALPPPYVIEAIKPWTDVVSVNNYRPNLYERYDTLYRQTGLPMLIGEVSWNTDLFKKVPLPAEGDKALTEKERMFRTGTNTLRRTALHDGIVGFTWYRWVQGVSSDTRFYDGVVNYNDEFDVHREAHERLLAPLDSFRLQAGGGTWKQLPLVDGEFTLLFDSLRTGWDHYLRMQLVGGKPLPAATGWKMTARVGKYNLKGNTLSFDLNVAFAPVDTRNGPLPAAAGSYSVVMRRTGERWRGTYKGRYNGAPIAGEVMAFYFPEWKP